MGTAGKGGARSEGIAEVKAAQHSADGFFVSFYLDPKTLLGFDKLEFVDHFFHCRVSPCILLIRHVSS